VVEQHSTPVVQGEFTGLHCGFTFGWHVPATQLPPQQSVLTLHAPWTGVHGMVHFFVFGSHFPWQQSASTLQVAFVPLQVDGGRPQRGGLMVSSQKPEQQPFFGPLLQVSPVGRQVGFARSIEHFLSFGSQMFEQHSALTVHATPSTLQIVPPQTPPLQARSQQSSALVHATPSARHTSRHCTFVVPVTGSQRPLQQAEALLQSAPGAAHEPGGKHVPLSQRPLQQSVPMAQLAPFALHWAAAHLPPTQLEEQQSGLAVHAEPLP
jgi:hypothetical protein